MKGIVETIAIDRLKFCCVATLEQAEIIRDTRDVWDRFDYKIIRVEPISPHKESFKIQVRHMDFNEDIIYMDFAFMSFGHKLDEDDNEREFEYVWFELDNKALYTRFYPNSDYSILSYIYYIIDDLNLTFNNITRLEIAYDTNKNTTKRIRRALKKYSPMICGITIKNKFEELENVDYLCKGNCYRIIKTSAYIETKDKKMGLRNYDKNSDVLKKSKDYIRTFNKMPSNFYRSEVYIQNEHIKQFCRYYGICMDELFYTIENPKRLIIMFYYFANRLIRFITPDKKKLTIFDI